MYRLHELHTQMNVFVDANWAGCTVIQKSITGMCIVHGVHLIKSMGKPQGNIALSSAEAERYDLVAAASEGLGCKAMAADFGGQLSVNIYVDAPAAIGNSQRKVLGRKRHFDTHSLWVQDAVREKQVQLINIRVTQNPAGMTTKYLDGKTMVGMMGRLALEVRKGRPDIALEVAEDYRDGELEPSGGR